MRVSIKDTMRLSTFNLLIVLLLAGVHLSSCSESIDLGPALKGKKIQIVYIKVPLTAKTLLSADEDYQTNQNQASNQHDTQYNQNNNNNRYQGQNNAPQGAYETTPYKNQQPPVITVINNNIPPNGYQNGDVSSSNDKGGNYNGQAIGQGFVKNLLNNLNGQGQKGNGNGNQYQTHSTPVYQNQNNGGHYQTHGGQNKPLPPKTGGGGLYGNQGGGKFPSQSTPINSGKYEAGLGMAYKTSFPESLPYEEGKPMGMQGSQFMENSGDMFGDSGFGDISQYNDVTIFEDMGFQGMPFDDNDFMPVNRNHKKKKPKNYGIGNALQSMSSFSFLPSMSNIPGFNFGSNNNHNQNSMYNPMKGLSMAMSSNQPIYGAINNKPKQPIQSGQSSTTFGGIRTRLNSLLTGRMPSFSLPNFSGLGGNLLGMMGL